MRFFEYKRNKHERSLKILGISVKKEVVNFKTSERIQEFFCGIIKTFKTTTKLGDYSKKEIKIFNIPIITRIEENNFKTFYFLGKEIYKISLLKQFKKTYFKYFDKNHDDIYILKANSGETYLTLAYVLDVLIKKNGSKNPLLVATKKYHIDIIKMFCPEIPYIYINKMKYNIIGKSFEIDKFRFHLLYDCTHLGQIEIDICNNEIGKSHYFKSILKAFNITEQELSMRKVKILEDAEKSMLNKVQKTGLNLDKFVFLAPEAYSCELYNEDFWCVLINNLQEKGYDVFVNLIKSDFKLRNASDFKTCYLSYAEVFALAKRAKKIVSLRSGLTEFLLQTNTLLDVLYTKFCFRYVFNEMDSYHVLSGFGMSQLPFVDKSKVQEFNTFEMSAKECIEKVLKDL